MIDEESEQLRIKVAWLRGWRYLNLAGHSEGNEWWFASPSEQEKYLPVVIHDTKPEVARFNVIGGAKESLPDFGRDLNACAEFEKGLTGSAKWSYMEKLTALLGFDRNLGQGEWGEFCWLITTATAEQRCRAFVALHEGKSDHEA